MHIVHVNFARGFRGGERQTLNLVTGLARRGIQQTLVCRSGSELARRARLAGLTVRECSHPLAGHLSPPAADLIHVHEARGAYWAAIEHLLRKTPYVITRRVPNPLSSSRITRAVYRHAAALFGVSREVSRLLAQQTGRSVDPILSCHSFAPVPAAAVAQLRARLGGGPVIGPIIGHVGALHDAHKGQSVLIDAFQRLQQNWPDARLVLVGEGPDRARFEALAGGNPGIVFAGFREDVDLWTAAMDVFAFPSREEGLGSSVLDAMAQGVPVIASTAGGLAELLGEKDAARGVAMGTLDARAWAGALNRLLRDEALRKRLATAGRQFAASHGIDGMTVQYLKAYAALQEAPAELAVPAAAALAGLPQQGN